MVFLLFLVSLGAMHVILTVESKRAKSGRRVGEREAAGNLELPPPASPEATSQGVYSLMQALEQHGRGEQPGKGAKTAESAELRKDSAR